MKKIITRAAILLIAVNVSGCAKLWPYKSDFDCPVPKGERCKSLFEVNQMADMGKFAPNKQPLRKKKENAKRSSCFHCHKSKL